MFLDNMIKLEICNKKTDGNYPNTWKLSKTSLNNWWMKEVLRALKNCFEINEDEKYTSPDL